MGFNMHQKQKEVKDIARRMDIEIVGLLDTRVPKSKMNMAVNNCSLGWMGVRNYLYNATGKIWVCWNPRIGTVRCINIGEQWVSIEVTKANGEMFIMTTIYDSITNIQRREVWNYLVNMSCT